MFVPSSQGDEARDLLSKSVSFLQQCALGANIEYDKAENLIEGRAKMSKQRGQCRKLARLNCRKSVVPSG